MKPKVVILAGGRGTRLSEETDLRPKPMVEIGGRPILWHIMKLYSARGFNDFVVLLGYRGYAIKEYFANYLLHNSDVTIDLRRGKTKVHRSAAEPWTVTLLDTGEDTMTGGRLRRAAPHLGKTFCLTYGDGVSDVDVSAVLKTHEKAGRLVTVTAVQPPGRFGSLELKGAAVERFAEKTDGDGHWINGGFFVVEAAALDRIDGDATSWEREPLERLAREGQLAAHRHSGFWQAMDTLRDRRNLEEMWESGRAPWKVWK